MLSIDVTGAQEYCRLGANLLDASVSYAVTGTYYTSAPTISFTGGGGSGAAGTAVLENGVVTSINITAAGTGYTTAPTVVFTGGGGTSAAGTAVLSGTTVASITMTTGGGKTITFTDNTVYDTAGGDSRLIMNVTIFDHFGNKKEGHATAGTSAIIISPLNPEEGIDAIVTVVSALGLRKDGSVHDITTLKTTGNVTMVK